MKNCMFAVILSSTFLLNATIGYGLDPSPAGSLKAFVVCSDTPSYIEKWASTPTQKPQNIRRVTIFAPGEIAHAAVIVTGYTIGKNGSVDLEAGFRFTKPDGSVLFERKTYSKYQSKNQETVGFVMLDPALDIGFDNTDTEGIYKLRYYVTDKAVKKSVDAYLEIKLSSQKYTEKILTTPITNPKVLDDLWGYYNFSKDERAVERIISVLHWLEDGHGMQIMLGGAARWSLKGNAYNNNAVYTICKRQLKSCAPENKKYLKEILAEVNAEKQKRQ